MYSAQEHPRTNGFHCLLLLPSYHVSRSDSSLATTLADLNYNDWPAMATSVA